MITRYEYDLDSKGEWRWTAVASNGEPIAVSSEGYRNLGDCLHAIALMKDSADAAIMPRIENRTPALASYALAGGAPRSTLARLLQQRPVRAEDTIIGAASKTRGR